ncbi:hypothetical protein ACFH04_01640 [Streptomyces noboritoensis]|uniref:Uncharacterized protein n=1 Tax=Streptomyces noboritoensis TaxID=67337 RepID=A0ABV6T9I6_9ACTN
MDQASQSAPTAAFRKAVLEGASQVPGWRLGSAPAGRCPLTADEQQRCPYRSGGRWGGRSVAAAA